MTTPKTKPEAIIAIGKALSLTIVAEGVETVREDEEDDIHDEDGWAEAGKKDDEETMMINNRDINEIK